MMTANAMIADSFAVRCLARAGVGSVVVMMTARTISAIYCLARASASGFFVMMTATISAVCCLARAGASGYFVVMTARVLGDFLWVAVITARVVGDHFQIAELTVGACCLQIAPRSWFGAGWDHLLLEDLRDCL